METKVQSGCCLPGTRTNSQAVRVSCCGRKDAVDQIAGGILLFFLVHCCQINVGRRDVGILI